MHKDPVFYPHTDSTTPIVYDSEKDMQEIQSRLNNPVEAYLVDIDQESLQHPEFVKQIIEDLPLYLAGSHYSDAFKELIRTPYLKEFVADDALVINSASQQILADYLNMPKIWVVNEDQSGAYLNHLEVRDIDTVASFFLDPHGLKNENIQRGLEDTLRYFLNRARFQSDIDFDDEIRLLEFLKRHKLDTSIYQSDEIKQLFLDKFNLAVKHKPFRIAGHGRESQTNAISVANFILGKDIEKIKAHLIYALPELLMEPASVWSLLSIDKVLSYEEAKEILPFNFSRNEYRIAANLARKAIKQANDYAKDNPFYDGDNTKIEIVLQELLKKN